MPVAKYQGQGALYDPNTGEYGNPGAATDSDSFGNPTQVDANGKPLVFSPSDPGGIKESHNGALKSIGASLGFGMSDADKDARARAKLQEDRLKGLGATIPDVIDASYVDPYKDIQNYRAGDPLDLTNAKTDLYSPEGTTRDLTGRGYQTGAADYLGGVMQSGHDAASDAYYEQKRAQAEQAGRAQRQAGVQQLQQRGMYNGGAGIMNELYAARSVGSDAHNAALGASAQAQARKDNAATQSASVGQGIQSGDDSWGKWFEGEQANYGRDRSNLDQNADVSNYNRKNTVNDQNTQMRDRLIVQNHQLPMTGYNMYRDLIGNQGRAGSNTSGVEKATEANPVAAVGDLVDKGAKVVELVHGLPPVGAGTAAPPKEKLPDEYGDDLRGVR